MAIRKVLKTLAGLIAMLAMAYGFFLLLVFDAMHQPPDKFGRLMKHMPAPMFMVVPFEPMWNKARGGRLAVGDVAPDFDLSTADKSSRVKLSSFKGQKAVVLVFGSYT